MFGILKSGIKLGLGCFIAGILFILLIFGGFYYYCSRKPAPRQRNSNRHSLLIPQPSPGQSHFRRA